MDYLAQQIRAEEGEVLYAYPDSEGYLTIGIGRMIDRRKGGGISEDEALYLFRNDLRRVVNQVGLAFPWASSLDPARLAVLCGMAFQMGIDGLKGFVNTMEKVRTGDYAGAAAGMRASKWARQTPERAERMAKQMETGRWYFADGRVI